MGAGFPLRLSERAHFQLGTREQFLRGGFVDSHRIVLVTALSKAIVVLS